MRQATEAELRAALRRLIVLDVSPGDFLPSDDPDWQMLNAAIDELVGLREGRYPRPDNPRPLRDFLGVLPARYMGEGEVDRG